MKNADENMDCGVTFMARSALRLLALFLTGSMSGCALYSPRLELSHAVLGEHCVFVEVTSYTDVHEYHQVHRELGLQRYLLAFSHGQTEGLHLSSISKVAEFYGSSDLQAAYSPSRLLRLSGYRLDENPVLGQLISLDRNGTWKVVREWYWPRRGITPPIAVDNDGRHLVTLSGIFETLDTSNLRVTSDVNMAKMFGVAARLEPGSDAVYYLTQNLDYLVVRLSERDSRGSDLFVAADGQSYPRGPDRPNGKSFYYAFIDRRTDTIGAFPDRFPPNNWHGSRSAYKGAAESEAGELLLLYADSPPTEEGLRYTIRSRDLSVRHEIVVPEENPSQGDSAGPDLAWNPSTNHVLFYDHRDLALAKGTVIMHLWDYKAGTLRAVTLDIAGAFRRDGNAYVPRAVTH